MDIYIKKISKKHESTTNQNSDNNTDTCNNNIDIFITEIPTKINSQRIFNTEYRKKLISKIENITDKNILIVIYNIIIEDIGNNYSSNRNGIFININLLLDNTIDKINTIVEENINININNLSEIKSEKIDCKIYQYDEIELLSEFGHKLSNQEKSIIKRIRSSKKI
jgi:hypothetical protein